MHSRLIHNGKKVKCHPVMESSDSSLSKISTFFVKCNMTSEKNVKEPMSEDQTQPMTTFEFIDVDELNALSQLRENSEQNTVTDSENVTPESITTSNILAPTPMDDLSSPAPILDEQPENVSVPSENTEKIPPPRPKTAYIR